MPFPTLRAAPIVEGLINIQTKPRAGFSVDDLNAFGACIKDSYPTVRKLTEIAGEIRLREEGATQAIATSVVGFRYEREAPRFVIHAHPGELLVSRLRPYDEWTNLYAETRSMWTKYIGVAKPETITRLATRFINRIELPGKDLDFEQYLTAPAPVPKQLGEHLEHFLTRVVIQDAKSGASIAISQALETFNPQTETVSILLDIDVYKLVSLPVEGEEAWELLNAMRELKNRAFFGSVTPKALELFK